MHWLKRVRVTYILPEKRSIAFSSWMLYKPSPDKLGYFAAKRIRSIENDSRFSHLIWPWISGKISKQNRSSNG